MSLLERLQEHFHFSLFLISRWAMQFLKSIEGKVKKLLSVLYFAALSHIRSVISPGRSVQGSIIDPNSLDEKKYDPNNNNAWKTLR
jgi:hypothetical protein